VTLLGILFFFVLAVNRGWIGPVARVSLGVIASTLVFSGGLTIRRKFGHLYYSAYGAAGAGIAGGYGTLLAATLRYHLLSDWTAVLVAAAIAAVAVATALAWSSELIAGLGLVGATLAPAAVGLQNGELTAAGTGFAALVFAGTALVAVTKNWQHLLVVGVAASLPQAAVLAAEGHRTRCDAVAVVAVFWLLFLAAAIALQRTLRSADLAPLSTGLVLVSATFAGAAASAQLGGKSLGWALLAVAAVYVAVAAVLFPRRFARDLSALLGAVGLAVGALAVSQLLSGPALAIAWAAEAAVLAWLARRVGEPRYQLGSIAYLAAALVHALVLDAPLLQLYEATTHPASGDLAFVGIAIAGAVLAYHCRPWGSIRPAGGLLGPLQPLLSSFCESQRRWRSITGWTASLAGLCAASLGLLGIAQSTGDDVDRAFGWGHVAVTGLWGLAALGVLALGLRLPARELRNGGNVWLGAVLLETVLFDSWALDAGARGLALLVAAVALVWGALLDRGERDPSALLAAAGLTIGAVAFADLLSGIPLVAVWAGLAALLAWFARRIGQARYQLGAFGYLAAALLHGIALDAPPSQLYEATGMPASGALALLLVAVTGAAVAYYARPWAAVEAPGGLLAPLDPAIDAFRSTQSVWRSVVGWSSALAALYVASLGILDLAQRLGGGGTLRPFEWGHVAVIGLWALVALALLEAGGRCSWPQFRSAGLVWLAAVLAQGGAFVSTQLSGDPRGFAFLVAAAALLAGSLLDRLRRPEMAMLPVIGTYSVASLALAVAGFVLLVGSPTAEGLALLALAGFYCAVAALVFGRDRDFAAIVWVPALGVALVAWTEPLSGTWLVLAWTVTAGGLSVVAERAGEHRLKVAALAYLLPAFGHAVWFEAPPSDFFESTAHPATCVPAVLFVALATVVLALVARAAQQRVGVFVAAVLALYGVSLSILGLAEEIGSGTVADRFHGGHAAVSAVWGLLGLVALYTALSRRLGWLQALGFGLFAISLAKIFLYDLTFLSSVARALSFLAVGAVLLLGGFFVQKLGAQRRDAAV
jgi:hypothetical protein